MVAMLTASACEADSLLSPPTQTRTTATAPGTPAASGATPAASPFAPTVLLPGAGASTAPTAVSSPLVTVVATPAPTTAPAVPFAQPVSSPTPSPAIVTIFPSAVATAAPVPTADPNCSLGRATAVTPSLVAPDTIFYVTGTGFQGDVAVTVGGARAEVLRIEAGRLTARVPASVPVGAAAVPVRVTTCDATLQASVRVALADEFSGNVTALDQGLLAAIHPLAVGTAVLPADLDTRTPTNTFLCRALDMAPRSLTAGFPGVTGALTEWFAVRFTGTITVPTPGRTRFRLHSDDGAKLYLDGTLLIDNDGLHTARSASNEIQLNAGPHDLRVDYFQGPGAAMALELYWETAAVGLGFPVTPEERVPASAYGVPAAIAR
jgi:hypothetical protein